MADIPHTVDLGLLKFDALHSEAVIKARLIGRLAPDQTPGTLTYELSIVFDNDALG